VVLSGSRKCPPVPPLPQPHLSVQHRLCARQSEEYRLQRLPAGVEPTLRHVSLSRTTLALYTLVSCVLVLTAPHLCVSWPYFSVSYLFGVLSFRCLVYAVVLSWPRAMVLSWCAVESWFAFDHLDNLTPHACLAIPCTTT